MPDNLPILFPDAKVRPSFAFPGVSVFTIIQAAGWPIYFLLLTSIIAVALIIERTTAVVVTIGTSRTERRTRRLSLDSHRASRR